MVAATQAAYILNGNLAYAGAPLGYAQAPIAINAPYNLGIAPAPIAVAPAAYAIPPAREIQNAPIVETVSYFAVIFNVRLASLARQKHAL